MVAGAYYAVEYMKKEPSQPAQSGATSLETPPAAPGGKASSWTKSIEVVGFRLTQNAAKKVEVHFLVVNHSGVEVQDLAGNVTLQARTSKQDEAPIGAFSFKVPSLGPYESKEMMGLLNTKLKVYELPDWQNLDQRVQITSPQ